MELKEGMYVRTKKGTILKYNPHDILYNEFTNEYYYVYDTYEEDSVTESITRASFDIIDLIQLGDYVNGEEVIRIYYSTFLQIGELPYVITAHSKYESHEIETIVTYEQFQRVEYEVK